VFSTAGTFTVVLIVLDDRGGTDSTSVTITISPQPPAGNPSDLQIAIAVAFLGAIIMIAGIGLAVHSVAKRRSRRFPPAF
jgi:hypothetical protein